MAMHKCYECGKLVSDTARACANCGAWGKPPFFQKHIGKIFIAVIVVPLLFVSVVKWNAPPPRPPESPPALTEEQIANLKIEEDAFINSKAGTIWLKHKHWSREDCETIANKEIRIGMNAEQVRLAWGKPYSINASTGSWGGA
jgi:hypothetical protein